MRLRAALQSLFVALILFVANPGRSVAEEIRILRAYDAWDSVGFNTHIKYTDSSYVKVDEVMMALRYLGVRHIRDSAPNPKHQAQQNYPKVAAEGLKFTFSANDDVPGLLARLHAFATENPGSIAAIEGPNEVNNWPVTHDGLKGTKGAQAYQAALFDGVKADPALKDIPVYNFSDWPPHAGKADFANVHPYAKKGEQPYATTVRELGHQTQILPNLPVVATETGYYTLPDPAVGWGGVDGPTQAKYLLNMLFDHMSLGIKRTFIYQLFDGYRDDAGKDQEKHFGVFDTDYRPKPAAIALRNLGQILDESGPSASTFTPTALAITVDKLPPSAKTLQIQKSDGWTYLVLWDEPPIWDKDKGRAIPHPPTSLKVTLPGARETVKVFEPLKSDRPKDSFRAVQTVAIELGDSPILVGVSPR